MSIVLYKKKFASQISLLIITIFWMSLFSPGIFIKIGNIKGQIIVILLWIISIMFSGKITLENAFRNISAHFIEILLLLSFVLINAGYWLLGRGDNAAYGSFIKSLLLLILYITILVQLKNNLQNYRLAIIIIIVVYTLIAIYTIPILYLNPFIARINEFSADEIPWFGSWGFFLPIGMAMPCFIAISSKEHGFLKIFLLASCLVISIMVLLSTFAASIILLILGSIGLYYNSKKNKNKFILIIGVIIFLFILLISSLDLTELPQLEHMVYKIPAIFNTSSGIDESDPRVRITMIGTSLNTFINNPVFGVGLYEPRSDGNNLIGYHSGIIDGLAQYGLFGIFWYFGFLIFCYKRIIRNIKNNRYDLINKARLISCLLFFIGTLINPVLIETGFCSLLFILAFSPINNLSLLTKTQDVTL